VEHLDSVGLPWQVSVTFPQGAARRYNLYCYSMGHGGRCRPKSEYRIQVKLGAARKFKFKDGASVLLGYYDVDQDTVGRQMGNVPAADMRVIAAWDPVRHIQIGVSSSCQVTFPVMHQAYLLGAGEKVRKCADGEIETAIVFRPEYLARYLQLASAGHCAVSAAKIMDSSSK
jgi:hypothetical protein